MVYYLVLRRLRMRAKKWDRLSWWEQQMYLEEMYYELKQERGEEVIRPDIRAPEASHSDLAEAGFRTVVVPGG